MNKTIKSTLKRMLIKRYPSGKLTKQQVCFEIQNDAEQIKSTSVKKYVWHIDDIITYLSKESF